MASALDTVADGMPAVASLSEAKRHHQAGRIFEAATLCRDILRAEPNNAAALHLLGRIAVGLENPEAAVEWFGKAVAVADEVAEYHDDLGNAYRVLGRFDVAAASHRRAIALSPERAATHLSYGKALRGQHRFGAAATAMQAALALEPDDAAAQFELGTLLAEHGQTAAARDCFSRAVALTPDFADAYTNLGLMLFEEGRFEEASRCYRHALDLAPDNAVAYNNLGNAREKLRDAAVAATCFQRAITLDPSYVAPQINLGNLLLEEGQPEAAMRCYQSAIAHEPKNVAAHQNLGLVQLMRGDFAAGWREWRFPAPNARPFRQPEWRGEPLDGATILLHAEQGLGDTLHFVRYVPLVAAKGGRVVLELPHELRRLLGSMAGAVEIVTCGDPLPNFAWHCPLPSLPLAFGTDLSTIPAQLPYVAPPAAAAPAELRDLSDGRLRVGLVWGGRPQHNRDHHRSLPLAALARLGQVPGVAFYSLQKGEAAAAQIVDGGAALRLVDLGPSLDDFTDTAAAVAALDLVIAVDTSVAHLAGALGKPVWILLSAVPDWRWLLGRDDSPWYPNARLFRQSAPGDWRAVVERLAAALTAYAASPREDASDRSVG